MKRSIFIDDAKDSRLAPYRDIREKDLVGRQGRFVAEGKVVLRVLAAQRRFEVESVLVLENKLGSLGTVLESLPSRVPIYTASRSVIDGIAGFSVHRGVLAIGRRRDPDTPSALLRRLPPRTAVLVLSAISNHDNVGGIFRNAAAFEAGAVLLDSQCCDPLYRKAIRVSVGAVLKVPFARVDSTRQAMEILSESGFQVWALSPGGSLALSRCAFAPRTAFILGSEGEGLPAEILQTANTLRIPMSRDFDSLNVATASAIALHRFYDGA